MFSSHQVKLIATWTADPEESYSKVDEAHGPIAPGIHGLTL